MLRQCSKTAARRGEAFDRSNASPSLSHNTRRWIASFAWLLALSLLPGAIALADDSLADETPVPVVAPVDVGLDPGHSEADVGAVGGGLREFDLTLDVAFRVRDLLTAQGLAVAMSRTDNYPLTDFSEPDPIERTRLEQEARVATTGNPRVFVSIHFNGFGDPAVRGTEAYFNGDNHGDQSKLLARSLDQRVVAEVRDATGYQIPDRGAKEDLWAGKPYGHFFSLRGDQPSALIESMFLTNPREAALLDDDTTLDAIARGIAAGIMDYFAAQP